MEITVTISDEVAEQAKARGLTPESYVEELIAEHVVPSDSEKTMEQKLADLEKFFEGMTANSHKIPHLPDKALTRESFYRDYD